MRILIANDDGYLAPGLVALVEACRGLGDIDVIAPEQNASGMSNSLTLGRPLSVFEARGGPSNGFRVVNGTPSDCVHVAMTGLLERRPDLVLSGINNGENMGDDTLYSGTVAAAMEGFLFGVPAIAFSLQHKGWAHIDAAARGARRVVDAVARRSVVRPARRGAVAAERQFPEPARRRLRALGHHAPGPAPRQRAGDRAEESARRPDLLDRPRGRRARGRRRHRFPRGGERARVDHAAAGRPHRPREPGRLVSPAGARHDRRRRRAPSDSRPSGAAPADPPRPSGTARNPLRPQALLHQAAQDAARHVVPTGLGLDNGPMRERMVARLRSEGITTRALLAAFARGAAPPLRRHRAGHPGLRGHQPADRPRARPSPSRRSSRASCSGCSTAPTRRRLGHLGRTLEIGTGCGYQTALLARLAPHRHLDRAPAAAAPDGAAPPRRAGRARRAPGARRRPRRPSAQRAVRQHRRRGRRRGHPGGLAGAAGARRPAGRADRDAGAGRAGAGDRRPHRRTASSGRSESL